jgi:hypothetical protein
MTIYDGTIYPVEVRMISKLRVSKCKGFFYGDGEYNSKRFLNKVVSQGYLPIIKPKKRNSKGFGARIRDKSYDGDTYKKRSVCEGFFGALTNRFGEDVPCFLDNTTMTRIGLRIVAYALKILLRFYINSFT